MFYDSKNISRWWTTTKIKEDVVFDHIIISYKYSNIVTCIPFKRRKVVYYNDVTEEYVTSYSLDIDFITLLNKLHKYGSKVFIEKRVA
ncbi:MAG: hypothetical protein JWP44_5043 [Mucilaginibacter sp.]|nr:hypothetical protein [Mucilaginibacter sp.]